MPKFLIQASYTADGAKGLMKGGGSARRLAVKQMLEGLGGQLESFYFAYGDVDVYAIADVPDNATAIAVSLAVNASGAVKSSTLPLITAEELDAGAKKSVKYSAPGA